MRRYLNPTKSLALTRSEQLWVADKTYVCVGYDFSYLSLIAHAYSKKIMGHCLHPHLTNEGTLYALKMAIPNRSCKAMFTLHSGRGVQFCSSDYIEILKDSNIQISLTQNGEAYIEAYHTLRPHMRCSLLTPAQAHLTAEPLIKHWKNTRKKRNTADKK